MATKPTASCPRSPHAATPPETARSVNATSEFLNIFLSRAKGESGGSKKKMSRFASTGGIHYRRK